MKAIVSGGAGFIGSHLVDRLVKDGHEVAVMDNLANGLESNINQKVIDDKLWWGCHVESDHASMRVDEFKPDVIFHLAALGSVPFSVEHPDKVFKTNVEGTANMLNAARKAGARFVFASSASYYGDDVVVSEFGPTSKVEVLPPNPLNHYGASKVMGELWGKAFHRMHGLEFVALRFFNVFGPRQRSDSQYAAVVPKFIKAALDRGVIELHGGGVQTRDLTYVSNVVDACVDVALAPAERVAGQSFNVCAGDQVSIVNLVNEVFNQVGRFAGEIEVVITEPRPGDIKHSFGSYLKLQTATGWQPSVSWRKGICALVKYEMELREMDRR